MSFLYLHNAYLEMNLVIKRMGELKKIPFLLLVFIILSCLQEEETQEPINGSSFILDVTNNNSSDYLLTGTDRNGNISGNDPDLEFNVEDTIFFFNYTILPFYLKTKLGIGKDNAISGVINNGTTNQKISWRPTSAGTYYYQCSFHQGMAGTITIQ